MHPRSDYDWDQANRQTVLQGRQALIRTSESLERSQRIANETEEIGTSIRTDLDVQREALERTRQNLQQTDVQLSQAKKILNIMKLRVFTNKFILWLIILLELGILGAAVYLKFFKK